MSLFLQRSMIFAYLEYNSSREYVSYEPVSSWEWRTVGTPTTDCELHASYCSWIFTLKDHADDYERTLDEMLSNFLICAFWLINSLGKIPARRDRCYWRPNSVEGQASRCDERYLLFLSIANGTQLYEAWLVYYLLNRSCDWRSWENIGFIYISKSVGGENYTMWYYLSRH